MTTSTNTHNDRNSGTSASTAGTAICHAVPCHISYTGPSAGVDIFFNPMTITTSKTTALSNDESNKCESFKPPNSSYQAAMIRGRGLLARCSDDGIDAVCGHVFQVVTDTTPTAIEMNHPDRLRTSSDVTSSLSTPEFSPPQKCLNSIQSFDQYTEWYHEHQTSVIPHPTTDINTRYHRAIEWMNTADCLHAPIPIPIKPSKEGKSEVCSA